MSSKDDPHHRLVLWFMRDLNEIDRSALFRLYGVTHIYTRDAQQSEFRKILASLALTSNQSGAE